MVLHIVGSYDTQMNVSGFLHNGTMWAAMICKWMCMLVISHTVGCYDTLMDLRIPYNYADILY